MGDFDTNQKIIDFRSNKGLDPSKLQIQDRDEILHEVMNFLQFTDEEIAFAWYMAREMRSITFPHCMDVAILNYNIGKRFGHSEEELKLLFKDGLAHDIGKSVISDELLIKDPITNAEYKIFQQHVLNPRKYLLDSPFAENIETATKHHEKLDGSGYLSGLSRNEIPWNVRITTISDCYNAAVVFRYYNAHKRKTPEEMIEDFKCDWNWEKYDQDYVDSLYEELRETGIIIPKKKIITYSA